MENIKFVALGGLDEEGKSCYVIEIDNSIFVIETGMKFPLRSMLGIDCIFPSNNYLMENKDRVKAYIITSGHDDDFFALRNFYMTAPAPIYMTKTTEIFCLNAFKEYYKENIKMDIRIVDPSDDLNIDGHIFHLFSTTHSVAQTFGFALETSRGNIIYTGDFMTDYDSLDNFSFDLEKLVTITKSKNTFLLLAESSASDRNGINSPNHKITPLIENYFSESYPRIFIGLYTQNLYNIYEVLKLAEEYNKKVLILDKNFRSVLEELVKNRIINFNLKNLIDYSFLNYEVSDDTVILITGSGEHALKLASDVCHHEFRYVQVREDDIFINALTSVPGTEVKAIETSNTIYKCDCKVIDIDRKILPSMHAAKEDLKLILSLTKPSYYIPYKGTYRKLMENAMLAINMNIGLNHTNVFVLDNGNQLIFDPSKNSVSFNTIETGDILVDGINAGDVNVETLNERTKMNDDGLIAIAVNVSSNEKQIVSTMDLQMRGCLFVKDSEKILQNINNTVTTTVKDMLSHNVFDMYKIETRVTDLITKYMRYNLKKEPIIVVSIIDIDKSY